MPRKTPKYSVQPVLPGADVNLLEEYVFGKPQTERKVERLARSENARRHRAEVKEIKSRKDAKDRQTKV